jgi:hypothetical protein
MQLNEWASTFAALTVVLTFIGGITAWIFKRSVERMVNGIIKEYLSELKPNSGSTLRDDIREVRKDINSMKLDIARLEGRFVQHLAETDSDSW